MANVELVRNPPWSPQMISPEGRERRRVRAGRFVDRTSLAYLLRLERENRSIQEKPLGREINR